MSIVVPMGKPIEYLSLGIGNLDESGLTSTNVKSSVLTNVASTQQQCKYCKRLRHKTGDTKVCRTEEKLNNLIESIILYVTNDTYDLCVVQ